MVGREPGTVSVCPGDVEGRGPAGMGALRRAVQPQGLTDVLTRLISRRSPERWLLAIATPPALSATQSADAGRFRARLRVALNKLEVVRHRPPLPSHLPQVGGAAPPLTGRRGRMELQHRDRAQAHRSMGDRVPLPWRSHGATDPLTFDADGADPNDTAELLRDAGNVVAARPAVGRPAGAAGGSAVQPHRLRRSARVPGDHRGPGAGRLQQGLVRELGAGVLMRAETGQAVLAATVHLRRRRTVLACRT